MLRGLAAAAAAPFEALRTDWMVDGTTGYDFAVRVNALFVDPAGEKPCTDIYAGFVGGPVDYEARVRMLAGLSGLERVGFPGPALGAAKSAAGRLRIE